MVVVVVVVVVVGGGGGGVVIVVKVKAIPLLAWTGPESARRLRFAGFKAFST